MSFSSHVLSSLLRVGLSSSSSSFGWFLHFFSFFVASSFALLFAASVFDTASSIICRSVFTFLRNIAVLVRTSERIRDATAPMAATVIRKFLTGITSALSSFFSLSL